MVKRADLSPALGYPGGACQVVERIQHEVRNPRLRDQLTHEVEDGDSLSNPEAAKVYDMEQERGAGFAKRLLIGPHTQYRMDLRGVTVPLIRAALKSFTKVLNDWKSRQDPQYKFYTSELARGEAVNFTEPRLGLTIVFALQGRDTVKIVTTYWKGERDPEVPRGGCPPQKYSYDRRAETYPLPTSFPKTEIGLMTMGEFIKFRNPEGKHHGQESYNFDLFTLNREHSRNLGYLDDGRSGKFEAEQLSGGIRITKEGDVVAVIHNRVAYYDDPHIKRQIPTVVFNGTDRNEIEFKSTKQVKYLSEVMPLISPTAKRKRAEYPVVLQHIIVRGEPMTIRAEKQPQKDKGTNLAILNAEGLEVAAAQNEWGATLLLVAKEYRGRGLGKIIGKVWYKLNPSMTSGGFTQEGEKNAIALWRDRVQEFSSRGWYSALVRQGKLTYERVKGILKGIGERPPRKVLEDTSVKATGEVLVFSDEITFVVYDKAFLEEPDEKFIHGFGFFRDNPHVGSFVFRIEYERKFANLTTRVALQIAKDNGDTLYNGEGYGDMLELGGIPGIEKDGDYITVTQNLFNVRSMASKEKRLRKAVDPYGEMYDRLVEMAESKW